MSQGRGGSGHNSRELNGLKLFVCKRGGTFESNHRRRRVVFWGLVNCGWTLGRDSSSNLGLLNNEQLSQKTYGD